MSWIKSLLNVDGKSNRAEFSLFFVLLLLSFSVGLFFMFADDNSGHDIFWVLIGVYFLFKSLYLIFFILAFLYGRALFRRLNDIGADRVYGLLIISLMSASVCMIFTFNDVCKILSAVFMGLFVIANLFLMFIKGKETISKTAYDRFVLNRLKYIILTVFGNVALCCIGSLFIKLFIELFDSFPAFAGWIYLSISVIYNIIVAGMRLRDMGYNFLWSLVAVLPITNLFAFILMALGKSAEREKLDVIETE